MKGLYSKKLFIRTGALYLAFTVFLAGVHLNEVFAAPTVDIKAAGPDAVYQGESLTINDGESYTYSLTSAGATVCAVTSPFPSGSIVDGVSTPVLPGESYYYPTVGNPVTITVECNDLGTSTTTDSVVIQLASTPPPPPPPPPSPVTVSADIKANGSDGPVTITDGDSYIYTWSSTNATVCAITSPFPSGSTLNGTSTPVLAGETLYYQTLGNPVTITFTCNNNGMATATDSVIINLDSTPPPPPPPSPVTVSADIKANGSDGPVTITDGDSYIYTWSSTNATVCAITSPFPSGSTLNGTSTPVLAVETLYYPTLGNPVTITFTCNNNGMATATDSVIINLASTPPPPPPPSPVTVSADIKANGSDGPVTITDGDSYIYTWSSTNATVCAITSPFPSGSTLNGTSTPVLAGETLYYPTLGNPVTITFTCNNNGMATATDSVIINLASTPPPPPPPSPPFCPLPSITSSLSSSVTVNQPFSYTITATSTGATSTTTNFSISGTLPAGLSFSTSTATISGTPTETGTFNLSMTAATDCGSDTDTLVITVNPAGGGGGGGGGSGGGGSSRTPGGGSSRPPSGEVLGATTSDFCPFLTGYMRIGYVNDPANVARLQVFLNIYEGSNLAVTGVFDEATFQAVEAFQLKYKDDILTPWGINQPTGYVYIRTLGKINQIHLSQQGYC